MADNTNKKLIRNFSIIAHIDHGKSTLADRLLELTKTVTKRDMKSQLLDSMELEQERGITIKLNAVQLKYFDKRDNNEYTFNLIDTPGHVDFTYEVSRSMAACEGAILVVDASQGIEAQTLANVFLALDNNLEVLPVINKIDLPSADPDKVADEIETSIGLDASEAPRISAKSGLNVEKVLDYIVDHVPYPQDADDNKPLKALIFDSYFDSYRGVVIFTRIREGVIKVGDKIKLFSNDFLCEVSAVGIKTPKEINSNILRAGEVGWISAHIRDISKIHIGDTITHQERPCEIPLPGYKKLNPMVFCGFYPIDNAQYQDLKDALHKILLSDSSLIFEPESSKALGFGFRIGFLGLLHMEIIQERLEREYNIPLIATAPSVQYIIHNSRNEIIKVDNPANFPDRQLIEKIEEPYVKATIMTPEKYVGSLMELCQRKRGNYIDLEYIDDNRRNLIYEIPLSEIVFDFFDILKSISQGYASFDYDLIGYKASNLVKMRILLNGESVDALSLIVHRDHAFHRGRALVKKLKTIIPRQNFEIPIQAAIGSQIISRETVKAMRKNVLSKCYGGDITRKKKLLEKQKKGKKKLKSIGKVELPQDAFIAVLKLSE